MSEHDAVSDGIKVCVVLKGPTGCRIQISLDPTISTGLKGEKMGVE
jgi:hypothetical protein